MKRAIQNLVLDELALKIVEGKIKEGGKAQIGVKKGKVIVM